MRKARKIIFEGPISDLVDGPGAFEDGMIAGAHRCQPEIDRLRAALAEIRSLTVAGRDRPWTALSIIDGIVEKALGPGNEIEKGPK